MKYWLSLLAILACIFILTACGTQAAQQPQVPPTLSAAEIQGTEQANAEATTAAINAIMTQAQQTVSALQAALPTITPTPEPYWPEEWSCMVERMVTEPMPFTLAQEGSTLSDPDAQLPQGVYQLEATISDDGLTVTGTITQGGVQMTTFVWQRSTEDAFIGYWDAEYSEGAFCCARPGTPLPEPCLLEH
jgi:hypothetical protein